MINFQIDKDKKVLFVELVEYISNDETLEAAKDFWTNIATVGRGSIVVCDITKFKNGSRVSRVLLQKVMRLLESYEPKAVVRIINGHSGAMVFDRAYNTIGATYKVYRVANKKEAMDVIDTIGQIPPVFINPPSEN